MELYGWLAQTLVELVYWFCLEENISVVDGSKVVFNIGIFVSPQKLIRSRRGVGGPQTLDCIAYLPLFRLLFDRLNYNTPRNIETNERH